MRVARYVRKPEQNVLTQRIELMRKWTISVQRQQEEIHRDQGVEINSC